jgi:hypothetical protein
MTEVKRIWIITGAVKMHKINDVHRPARHPEKPGDWRINVDATGKVDKPIWFFAGLTQIGLSTYFRLYALLSANLQAFQACEYHCKKFIANDNKTFRIANTFSRRNLPHYSG